MNRQIRLAVALLWPLALAIWGCSGGEKLKEAAPAAGKAVDKAGEKLSDLKEKAGEKLKDLKEKANTGSTLTSEEANELVQYHNKVRTEVGVGPINWSPTLAKFAQQWADEVARTGKLDHRPESQYGENMAWGSGGKYGVLTGAEGWYNEIQFYTPGTPIPNNFPSFKAGHYTQMVWKDTTEIGAGKAVIQKGDWKGGLVIVCNYNPPGNSTGKKPY